MKIILLLYFYTTIMLNASSKQEIDCYSILQQIDKLKKEKNINLLEKVGSVIVGGHYPLNSSSKELEIKIRILKLKLLNCK